MVRTREAAREAWKSEDDRGAVLFIMVFFLIIFIAVATLAVDLAAQGARGQNLQNASDAAALAGVAEYQRQIVAGVDPATAADAARAVTSSVLEQNGIDPGRDNISFEMVITDEGVNGTRLEVIIRDSDPDQFLPSDFLGQVIKVGDSTIERTATAEFLMCKVQCSVVVTIPAPFEAISARGNGDGYKPIEVERRLYALNHNSGARNIVCVDKDTRERCWADSVYRPAYAGNYNDRNPEMPHTAVVNNTIYWAATDASNGLRLFCFIAESGLDVPCADAWVLDSSLRRYNEGNADNTLTDDKDENRGGGTFAFNDKVYVFSDNHRIHCYDPAFGGTCSGFNRSGNPTALDVFPASSPEQGNHGSSIDRILDEDTGKVYSTLHIPFAQEGVDCSSDIADALIPGERVVIINADTLRYLSSLGTDDVRTTTTGATSASWWDVDNPGPNVVTFQSAAHGEYLDADPFIDTSSSVGAANEWDTKIEPSEGNSYVIDSVSFGGSIIDDGGTISEGPDEPFGLSAGWNFKPWQCGVDPTLMTAGPDYFESGTWLHCYDLVAGAPCSGFQVNGVGGDPFGEPSPIHLDGTRFSGRLWFYYSSGASPVPLGVCSSGYGRWYAPGSTNMSQSDLEINCVTMTGAADSGMTNTMNNSVTPEIASHTRRSPSAWGDPHWNEAENRLLYPTEHSSPFIVCYDFDTGSCTGISQTITDDDNVKWRTEDYGFVSDGNCVYALGHTAFFWAFKASDLGERCDPLPARTSIDRCECGEGEYAWGTLDFSEIDMDRFEAFGVRILTDDGDDSVAIYPSDGSYHSIKPGGAADQISLDDLSVGFPPGTDSVQVEIYVEGSLGEEDETLDQFEIRFPQRPKLVD